MSEIIIHSHYNQTGSAYYHKDVALLRLKTPIFNIEPLPLTDSEMFDVTRSAKIIGWGKFSPTSSISSALKKGSVKTQNCEQADYPNASIEEHICAKGDHGQTPCKVSIFFLIL